MNIKNLEKCFYEASQQDKKYVGVKVQMQGFPKPEIIINENENFDSKFDYYKKSCNEDLTLKAFSGIKIIGFTYGNSFQEIENDLTESNITHFDFGSAIAALKEGWKVARKGWNGKNMYLTLIHAGNAVYRGYDMQDCIGIKTANNLMQPGWLASQIDILAEDWEVVE